MSDGKDDYSLTLKFGTLKAWNIKDGDCRDLLKKYLLTGISTSLACHKNTIEQKNILCELIDKFNYGKIYNDWEGTELSKEEAKDYIMNYGL